MEEEIFAIGAETIIEDTLPPLDPLPNIPNSYWRPEHELWKAVLEDAIFCYDKLIRKYALEKYNFEQKDEQELQELVAWFFSKENYVGGFLFICDVLFLENDPILKYIVSITKKHIGLKELNI